MLLLKSFSNLILVDEGQIILPATIVRFRTV